ncbi:hypothetical protein B9Z55_020498 [Caenorhabditis nigoni]|uniref:Uncharacterized protein n=1 Tax=Caenorhabditis nigoni TaxID=1611254 RepID=A0A2G5TMY0_9PELO|nr:hypothetical protein B9Z55_020498 [Caenorhabditis nigoni]
MDQAKKRKAKKRKKMKKKKNNENDQINEGKPFQLTMPRKTGIHGSLFPGKITIHHFYTSIYAQMTQFIKKINQDFVERISI